jgi:alkanesulfonate monooxygenase SsuD/methylene tetrahydromethanopterin reductase-like flavin-dependent oxidoreductase (luciferase family)
MWIGGASEAAIRRTARFGTGWQGGPETPAEAERVIAAIRVALTETGRAIEDDHYGASFPYYFGRPTDRVVERALLAYRQRTGRDADVYFAIGDAAAIMARLAQYVAAGVSKFILRPLGGDDAQILAQTRQLIEQVLPAVEARWPRKPPHIERA